MSTVQRSGAVTVTVVASEHSSSTTSTSSSFPFSGINNSIVLNIPESALPPQAKTVVARHQFRRRFLNDGHLYPKEKNQPNNHQTSNISYDEEEGEDLRHSRKAPELNKLSDFLTSVDLQSQLNSKLNHNSNSSILESEDDEFLYMSIEECVNAAKNNLILLSELQSESKTNSIGSDQSLLIQVRKKCDHLRELLKEHVQSIFDNEPLLCEVVSIIDSLQ